MGQLLTVVRQFLRLAAKVPKKKNLAKITGFFYFFSVFSSSCKIIAVPNSHQL